MKIVKTYKQIILILILIFLDLMLIFLIEFSASSLRSVIDISFVPNFNKINHSNAYWFAIVIFLFLYSENIYTERYDFWQETKKILKSIILGTFVILSILVLTKVSIEYSRIYIILFFTQLVIIFPITKLLIKNILFKSNYFKLKVTIKGDNSDNIKNEIIKNRYLGMMLADSKSDIAIINSKDFSVNDLDKQIRYFLHELKDVYIIPYIVDLNFNDSGFISYDNLQLSAIKVKNNLFEFKYIVLKRISDYIFVIALLPFFISIHIFISFAIFIDSRGNIFYKQKRFGKDKKLFKCYKYRTMYKDGDEILKEYLRLNPDEVAYYKKYHKYKNDPRITAVGKFLRKTSLDELPQFLNIIKGEMSLIGPRPYSLDEETIICDSLDIISIVRPGITGYWQVNGRNDLTFEKRVALEQWYVKNWSLWLDFIILLKTFYVLLFKRSR